MYVVLALPIHNAFGEITANGDKYFAKLTSTIYSLQKKINQSKPESVGVKIVYSSDNYFVKDARVLADNFRHCATMRVFSSLKHYCNHAETINEILSLNSKEPEAQILVILAHSEVIAYLVNHLQVTDGYVVLDQEVKYAGYVVDRESKKLWHIPRPKTSS